MQGERRRPAACMIALVLLSSGMGLLGGCQQSRELPIREGRVVARGNVTLDKVPLESGQISFAGADLSDPADQEQWHEVSISNGKFEIEIPPGNYAVRIQKYKYHGKQKPIPLLPAKYNDQTTLTAEISERGPNQLSFQLESQ